MNGIHTRLGNITQKKWKELNQQTQGLQIEMIIQYFLINLQSKWLEYKSY